MESWAIPMSIGAGILFYVCTTWLARDRDDPRDAGKMLRSGLELLALAAVLVVLLLLPWALFSGWSLRQVLLADLPYVRMQTTVWAVYAATAAAACCLLHAALAGRRTA